MRKNARAGVLRIRRNLARSIGSASHQSNLRQHQHDQEQRAAKGEGDHHGARHNFTQHGSPPWGENVAAAVELLWSRSRDAALHHATIVGAASERHSNAMGLSSSAVISRRK
jgi:hypothetical protein